MTVELLRERYEPLAVVGRGGEGEVIRALDHLHGRQVALKVRLADESSRVQMLSEARLLLSLEPHPGLPLVREDFFVDGRYVIAMDWIDGWDLDAVLAGEGDPGLDPARAIDCLEQVAEALGHLHRHDPPVVHGDVKPANMVVTSSGRVVLVDFGLSSRPDDDPRRAGTAGYVAPELAAGGRPTPASDVYSFAATALVLLTGEPPSGGPPGWGAIEPERIAALERIIRRNLAADPARRDTSAAVVVERLRRWWGADLPSGTVTFVLADGGTTEAEGTEDRLVDVARAHGGHTVARVADEPPLMAFASVRDGLGAARAVADAHDARVAVVTGYVEPRAGTYVGEPVARAAQLRERAARGQVVLDEASAGALDGRLPAEIGLAELRLAGSTTVWSLVGPGLTAPELTAGCPYRGLIPFGSEDDDLYFGREDVVGSILGRLRGTGFMAVVGASGSGKSSLVRAGLVPALIRKGGRVVVMTPGPDPSAELERSLASGPVSLLIVDQLEEAFTLCKDDNQRAAFLDRLFDLRESGVVLVVALRADFYGRCAEHPRLASAVAEHQHLLGPMQAQELRRAIEGPARVAGLRLEPGLVDAMSSDVEGEPGALPLLSHALYESWSRRDGRVLTLAGYRAAGGVRGAIALSADEAYAGCSQEEQALMRQIFLRLTELGDGTDDTRRRVRVTELIPSGEESEATAVLETLTASRLLVVDDDSAEIAHEALIREWPRLRGWLTEDRDDLRVLRQLATASRAWEEGGRDDADLYRGARLEAAVERSGDRRHLTPVDREFLEASREAQEHELTSAQRRVRRLRALLAGVAVALVLAAIAGAFALVQRGSARHTATVAQAGRLAAQSREAAVKHPDLALLLALEAGKLDDSVDARGALLGALQHGSRISAWLQGFDAPVLGSAFTPDGKLLATVTQAGVTLWDTATWRVDGAVLRPAQAGAEAVDVSPDGEMLAIGGLDGRVEIWDIATRMRRLSLTDPAAASSGSPALAAVRFSPDGALVAAGGLEANHVTLWDLRTGQVIGGPITTNPPGTGGAHSISFSPDSTKIAVPSVSGKVGIWSVATGRGVGRPLIVGDADVEAAIFADDGRTIITSDDDGAITTLDVKSGRVIGAPLSVGNQVADSLDLSSDGLLLASATFDGSVFVWDRRTGTEYGAPLRAETSPVNDVVFSPDGSTLVSSHLRSAVVWDMSGGHAVGALLGEPTDVVTDVAFSSDGGSIVAGQLSGDAVVYDASTRRPVARNEGSAVVSAVAAEPDGALVAVGTVDGHVRFFDRTSGKEAGPPIVEPDTSAWQVAFSPDGRLLAVAVDPNGAGEEFFVQPRHGFVQLWDVESRRRVGLPTIAPGAGSVLALAFSADGTTLATGSYRGRLDLWDVDTGARVGGPMRVTDDGVLSVAFDQTGRLVSGGGAVGPVRVWRAADGSNAFPALPGHTGPVTGVAFSDTGSLLATTSVFGGTRLWDSATGLPYGDELVSPRPESLEPTIDLPFLGMGNAFSPDGTLLAAAGADGHAMVWDVDPKVWGDRACASAGRNLTREEWALYLPAGTPYRPTCPQWPSG